MTSAVIPPVVQPPASTTTTPVFVAPPPAPAVVVAALAPRLPGLACSLLHAGLGGGGAARIAGLAGAGAPTEAVRRAVQDAAPPPAAVTWDVRSFDGPYCPVLDLIRALSDGGMALDQEGGPAPLRDGDVIALRATMPGFAGFLHVAYIQSNGTVSALVPGPGYPAQTYAANAPVILGTRRSGSPDGWQVGPPPGTDMIVAVASTAPLFAKALPDDMPLAAYLSSLQAAVDALRRRGGTVAGAAQLLDTLPAR